MDDEEKALATETYTTETKYSVETGLPLVKFVRLNNVLQSPPDDTPSYTLYDEQGRVTLMKWHHQGQVHRNGAGAVIYVDPETKIHTSEGFYIEGQPRRRSLGPYIISRDRMTGEVTREQFDGDPYFPATTKPPAPS